MEKEKSDCVCLDIFESRASNYLRLAFREGSHLVIASPSLAHNSLL